VPGIGDQPTERLVTRDVPLGISGRQTSHSAEILISLLNYLWNKNNNPDIVKQYRSG